jgi:hypothetical protein
MKEPDFRQMTRREIEDHLIERSLVDPEFRARLIQNPSETLSALGLPVGADVKIQVLVEEIESSQQRRGRGIIRLVLHRFVASSARVA